MNDTWQAALEGSGARIAEGLVVDFGAPALELAAAAEGDVAADLSHLGVLEVSGADAAALIQGQFSNDIREVSATRSQLSALCSPKGRILAAVRVVAGSAGYHLVLPRETLEPTLKRLNLFKLRSDAALGDATGDWVLLGVKGPAAVAAVTAPQGPPAPGEVLASASVRVVGLPPAGDQPRALVLVDPSAAPGVWERVRSAARPVGVTPWRLTEVRAGVPEILPANADAFVPQMANLQLVDGVSFTKGCYSGQEVVARMQYLGKLKRRMYRARVAVDPPPAPATDLHAPGQPGDQAVGRVVTGVPAPGGGAEILAVIQIEVAESAPVHLGAVDGPVLDLLDLPYPLEV